MAAGKYNFTIEQGATFNRSFTWRDEDEVLVPLDGLTARMHIRAKQPDVTTLLELTTENGRIILDDPGNIELFIDSDTTGELDFASAVYDLEIVDPSDTPEYVTRLLQGNVTLSKEVTREA